VRDGVQARVVTLQLRTTPANDGSRQAEAVTESYLIFARPRRDPPRYDALLFAQA
jgi:hypothetical protein